MKMKIFNRVLGVLFALSAVTFIAFMIAAWKAEFLQTYFGYLGKMFTSLFTGSEIAQIIMAILMCALILFIMVLLFVVNHKKKATFVLAPLVWLVILLVSFMVYTLGIKNKLFDAELGLYYFQTEVPVQVGYYISRLVLHGFTALYAISTGVQILFMKAPQAVVEAPVEEEVAQEVTPLNIVKEEKVEELKAEEKVVEPVVAPEVVEEVKEPAKEEAVVETTEEEITKKAPKGVKQVIIKEKTIVYNVSDDKDVKKIVKSTSAKDEDDEDIDDNDDDEKYVSKSFEIRIPSLEIDVREAYSKMKNELLSYRDVHSRISKTNDAFRFKGDLVAKITVSGKGLKLYLNLDPFSLDSAIYHQRDASSKKKFQETPFVVKVKSPLSVKKAVTLIDMACEKAGTQKKSRYVEKDYTNGVAE